jgi:hypothetical protein
MRGKKVMWITKFADGADGNFIFRQKSLLYRQKVLIRPELQEILS